MCVQTGEKEIQIVESIVNKYCDYPGPAIPILQEIQARLGYVAPDFIKKVAELTGIPVSELYGIVTFYSQFRLEPLGKYHIQICHGTACHLAGAELITEALEMETGTKSGSTSKDGMFTLEKVACMGCCTLGPVIGINGEIKGRLTPDKVKKIIHRIRQKDEGVGSDKSIVKGGDLSGKK